ncbi:MAG: CDP-diacylglycerol--serine O-phosphatidyltransferase [Candidatus Hydrogenedentes bacterium]|nr:CDP-diacylglycerol--serine O-phosphatidyltransferase [Candidatus Hydrogenedentota bacterium]
MKRISFKRDPEKRGHKLIGMRKRRISEHRRPINVLASAITTLNLYCGIASIFAAIEGEYTKAAYWIFAAIVMDMLDGSVARVTKSISEFGKQLDSLCDVVSFGVAPAVLIYQVYLPVEQNAVSRVGAVMAIIYAICTALRLARFNVFQAEIREYFIGLPSPAAAATIASFSLFTEYFELNVAFWIFGPLTLLIAYLMVSTIQYPKNKMKSMLLAPRNGFRLLALCAVGIAVFDYASRRSPSIVLFPLAAFYCLFGMVDTAYRRFVKKQSKALPAEEPPAAQRPGA